MDKVAGIDQVEIEKRNGNRKHQLSVRDVMLGMVLLVSNPLSSFTLTT